MKTSQDQLEVVKAVKDLKRNGRGGKSHLRKMNRIQKKKKRHIIGGCKGHNLWCAAKHNATNYNLLKNIKSSDDKDAENNLSSTNSNAVSFVAQMTTILHE